MHLDYLLQALEWGLRIRIFKISWGNITAVQPWLTTGLAMRDSRVSLLTGSSSPSFFSEWWLIYGQGGHKHRRKRTRANSHKPPELSLTGKLGKAKISGDQNCVNGSHFFLGFNIWKAVCSSLLLQGVVLNRSCPCSRIRRSGTWRHRRNEDSKREDWASGMTQFIRTLTTKSDDKFSSHNPCGWEMQFLQIVLWPLCVHLCVHIY